MSDWTFVDVPDQTGRRAVVTGANSGLGLHVARGLARAGATVVLACRNTAKAAAAAERLRAENPAARVEVGALDLADLASVQRFADRMLDAGPIDLLVNNAGLMAVDQSRTVDGFETQIRVNHLGHFALTARLLPAMLQVPGSRVATMSSFGHRPGRVDLDDLVFDRRRYSRWAAYFQSKLANLLFTLDLQRRLSDAGASTIAVAAHPGFAHTDLGVEGSGVSNRMTTLIYPYITQSAAIGALPMLRALTDPAVQGGAFYGPRWMAAGLPVLERPSRRARDPRMARALGELSERLTGVPLPV